MDQDNASQIEANKAQSKQLLSEEMKTRLAGISAAFATLVQELEKHWLYGRCMSIAQTKIEEAHMWLMQMPNDTTIKKPDSPIMKPMARPTPQLLRQLSKDLPKT